MVITEDVKYVGVNDRQVDLFEGQYPVKNGMAYNSYVILDNQVAIMDTVDRNFSSEWLENIEKVLNGRMPDYLIMQHMEPDHSASVKVLLDRYPDTKVLASAMGFNMLKNLYGDIAENRQAVKEGDVIDLGHHRLHFVAAPMVHWPEVIMTYDEKDHILFSADAFGKFGALDQEEDWVDEARRYYFGIVGKFGVQAQAVLKKAAGLDIQIICPLHGPVLKEDLARYLNLYQTWTTYGVESDGVTICYTSVYGHTKEAAECLAEKLREKGKTVEVFDLARCDMSEALSAAFRYGTLVLATTTYNGDMFPFMKDFICHLQDHAYQNRKIAFIENGSWAPMATRCMQNALSGLKNLTYAENNVTIAGAVNESVKGKLDALSEELTA